MRKLLLVAPAAALAWGAHWLWVGASVGAGFATHVVCSLALISKQDPEAVLRDYVRYEAAPLGPVLHTSVSAHGADGSALGLVRARAIRRRGLGCTLLPGGTDGAVLGASLNGERPRLDPEIPWPLGAAAPAASAPPGVAAAIERAFAQPAAGPARHTTAVVVAHDGRLVAERYAPGYAPETPMLSWSMAKSVTAALIGIEVGDGRLALRAPAPVPEWSGPGDPRGAITLDQLLRMSSGLAFDESYGPTSEVSRMLFTQPDTGAFAARSRLAAPPDRVWSYSSGTTNIVARMLRDLHGRDLAAQVRFANERLFDPAGMTSAFFEPDVSGTFIGSSFAFMTARDWARFGELHRRDGVWSGRRILPEGWVRYVTTPTPAAPNGGYGAHWWLNAGDPRDAAQRPWRSLPADAYAAEGHSGEHVVVVPSAKLVVVRLGLSVPDDNDHDGTEQLVAELIRALGE
jgi:CubicO group peptidase (beta-lactamase class C family)